MTYVIVKSGKVTDVEDISEQHNWVCRQIQPYLIR